MDTLTTTTTAMKAPMKGTKTFLPVARNLVSLFRTLTSRIHAIRLTAF